MLVNLGVLLRPSNEPSANRTAYGVGTNPGREGVGGLNKVLYGQASPQGKVQPNPLPFYIPFYIHGSYKLEKVLNFTSRLEKLLEFSLGP